MLRWSLRKIQLDGKNFVHCLSKLRVSDLIWTACRLYMVTSGPPQVNSHLKHFSYTHVGSTSAALTQKWHGHFHDRQVTLVHSATENETGNIRALWPNYPPPTLPWLSLSSLGDLKKKKKKKRGRGRRRGATTCEDQEQVPSFVFS